MKTQKDTKKTQAPKEPEPSNTKKVRARNWCFTLNNYDNNDIQFLKNYWEHKNTKYIFQEEKGEEGTPHLQGVVSYINPVNFETLKKAHPKAHWEKCRNLKASVLYCQKGETRTGGTFAKGWTFKRKIIDRMNDVKLYPWQQEIKDLMKKEPDWRSINWYWSHGGKVGKSSLARHLFLTFPNQITFVSGKSADVFYGLSKFIKNNENDLKLLIIDIPADGGEPPYDAMEKVLDGFYFSGKYDSEPLIFNAPHIVVFANKAPNYTKMKEDRWRVVCLDEK